jgi:hypothetical protein
MLEDDPQQAGPLAIFRKDIVMASQNIRCDCPAWGHPYRAVDIVFRKNNHFSANTSASLSIILVDGRKLTWFGCRL